METPKKIRIAFIKYGGLASSGTEKFLQNIAIKLPKEEFEVDYYYCDAAPYKGADFIHPTTDPRNIEPMEKAGVRLIKFEVEYKDATKRTFPWVNTNFWEAFEESKYDLIQTGRAGAPEYPFTLIRNIPIVDSIHFLGGIDNQFNISRVMHITHWSAQKWVDMGGDKNRVRIISHPMIVDGDLGKSMREDLGLQGKIIFGFHQRDSNTIFSDIPLAAFKEIENDATHFIVMGGGSAYREQAISLGLKNITFIDFTGDREKIYSFLKTLDVYAHGRKDGEVNSTAMAEALYFGVPIISHTSSVHNGHIECIGDAGKVVSTLQEYVQTMQDCLVVEHRKDLSLKAKKRFDDLYEETKQMKNIISIYNEVLADPFPHPIVRFISSFRVRFLYKKLFQKLKIS